MVNEKQIEQWLRDLRHGRKTPRQLAGQLKQLPFKAFGSVRLDTHRSLRRGLPEVILGEGKSLHQLRRILGHLAKTQELVLVTRLSPQVAESLSGDFPGFSYDPVARLSYRLPARRSALKGMVAVVTGGTSDLPVAEEASVTLGLLGSRVTRLYDVGVAGVHRILSQWELLRRARVVVVIAGMEGALASVVAGLVACPVIAVPSSVGYGASFQGIAPLLAMLSSCVPGIGVVNIDNGFGAAYLAHVINAPPRR